MHISRIAAAVAAVVVLGSVVGAAGVGSAAPPSTASAAVSASAALPATATPRDIFPGGLYRDATADSVKAAQRLAAEGKADSAALIRRISDQPTAVWLGDWLSTAQLKTVITRHLTAARAQGTTPVFVTYAVPGRDCAGYSAGGLTPSAYYAWNRTIAASLAGSKAVIIVEPDALAMLTGPECAAEKKTRPAVIRKAVDILTGGGLAVYLDAGHSNWVQPSAMAPLLISAGVAKTRGFATNVSNYNLVDKERAYAQQVSAKIGGKNYVIDVSRNGTGWQGEWCNPAGAAIGEAPRVTDGRDKLDALLWVKRPGESDGTCNGGPAAGTWWESYALDLVRNS